MRKKGESSNNCFEDLCLRKDYFIRSENRDLDIKPFMSLAQITAHKIWESYNTLFRKVNMDVEDLKNISSVYVYHYLNLYSLNNNKKELEKFTNNYRNKYSKDPDQREIDRIEKNHLIGFLRQKLKRCAYVCDTKAKNIVGEEFKKKFFAYTAESKPVDKSILWDEHKKYGYRKVNLSEIKEVSVKNSKTLQDKNGYKIFCLQKGFMGQWRSDDYEDLLRISYSNNCFKSPEDLIVECEDDRRNEYYNRLFNDSSNMDKVTILENFIEENKDDVRYKSELVLAKRMIAKLK
jgi:hypothetical protein